MRCSKEPQDTANTKDGDHRAYDSDAKPWRKCEHFGQGARTYAECSGHGETRGRRRNFLCADDGVSESLAVREWKGRSDTPRHVESSNGE
jgi:hypothetical protein